jgi:hypothetical protein
MNRSLWIPLAGVLLLASADRVAASIIAFDDLYAAGGTGASAATFYLASYGVTVSGTNFGAVGGIGNGDPGNWHLNGTNGPAFLGCNSDNSCSPTFTWTSPISSVSVDVGLPAFSWDSNFLVQALLSNVVVGSDSFNLVSGARGAGPWHTSSFNGRFDQLKITASFNPGLGLGVDNLVFAPVPEPSSFELIAIALFGLSRFARRIQRKAP